MKFLCWLVKCSRKEEEKDLFRYGETLHTSRLKKIIWVSNSCHMFIRSQHMLCRLAILSTDTVISVDSLPSPRIQEVGSYTFDRDAELWLSTTAPSASSLLCESKEPFIFKASFSLAFSFLFFFSSSISVKFSASARLSTAMAKKTFKRMSNKCQGISQAKTKQKRCF